MKVLRVGARGSKLSVWQAEFAIDRLRRHGVPAQLCILLLGTCSQQEWDIEKLIKDRLAKLPTLPMPSKGKEKVRGLRL